MINCQINYIDSCCHRERRERSLQVQVNGEELNTVWPEQFTCQPSLILFVSRCFLQMCVSSLACIKGITVIWNIGVVQTISVVSSVQKMLYPQRKDSSNGSSIRKKQLRKCIDSVFCENSVHMHLFKLERITQG